MKKADRIALRRARRRHNKLAAVRRVVRRLQGQRPAKVVASGTGQLAGSTWDWSLSTTAIKPLNLYPTHS